MNQIMINKQTMKWTVFGKLLRHVCGWSLLASASGVFIEAVLCGEGCTDGSFGLLPLYIGFLIGSVTFILIVKEAFGWLPATVATLGVAGTIATLGMVGAYYATGTEPAGYEFAWIGAIFLGIAHLFFPLSGRLAAVFWIMTGTLGMPEFYARPWGIVGSFTLFGVATAWTGLFILFGLPRSQENNRFISEEANET